MKTCFKCKTEQPIENFYKCKGMADGLLGKCKTCTKLDVTDNYRKNKPHYMAYEDARKGTPKRKAQNLKRQKNARKKNPEQHKVYNLVSRAIKAGTLVKLPCEVCSDENSEAHHDDYSKPLEVRWLCRFHHAQHHGKLVGEQI